MAPISGPTRVVVRWPTALANNLAGMPRTLDLPPHSIGSIRRDELGTNGHNFGPTLLSKVHMVEGPAL